MDSKHKIHVHLCVDSGNCGYLRRDLSHDIIDVTKVLLVFKWTRELVVGGGRNWPSDTLNSRQLVNCSTHSQYFTHKFLFGVRLGGVR